MIYFDSSAVIKLYYPEAETGQVATYAQQLAAPVAFSHLHSLEVRNSLRLKVFRKEAAGKALRAALELIDEDLASGVLLRPDLNWFDVYRHAENLSRSRTVSVGSRSLDLLHVACALLLEADGFLTFDERQRTLAIKAGLDCITLG